MVVVIDTARCTMEGEREEERGEREEERGGRSLERASVSSGEYIDIRYRHKQDRDRVRQSINQSVSCSLVS